ncbi:hypothetical protein LCGC14_1794850, partial [marine sediment metagenome]
DFNRADSATVGNGWNEGCVSTTNLEIVDNSLQNPGGAAGAIDRSVVLPTELIFQVNWKSGIGGNAFAVYDVRTNICSANNNFVRVIWNEGLNRYQIQIRFGGADQTFTHSRAIAQNDTFTIRLVLEEVGTFKAKLYEIFGLATTASLDTDFGTAVLDVTPINTPLNIGSSFMQIGAAANVADEYIICGRNVIVNDLDSGRKIRFITPAGTGSFVSASGGSGSIDVNSIALPGNRLEVFESDESTLVDAFQSASGLWGGDVYTLSAV